jgi:hypothetical protein
VGKQFPGIEPGHRDFIARQQVFFTASAAPGARVNVSPREIGRILRREGADYARLLAEAFAGDEPAGARQIVVLDIDLVQTSCGFGVPLFDYQGERPSLNRWSETKSEAELDAYRRQKNARSLDGLPTGLFEDDGAR